MVFSDESECLPPLHSYEEDEIEAIFIHVGGITKHTDYFSPEPY